MAFAQSPAIRTGRFLGIMALSLVMLMSLIKGVEGVHLNIENQPMATPTAVKNDCPEVTALINNYQFEVVEQNVLPGSFFQGWFAGKDLAKLDDELVRAMKGGCKDVKSEESILSHAHVTIGGMLEGGR